MAASIQTGSKFLILRNVFCVLHVSRMQESLLPHTFVVCKQYNISMYYGTSRREILGNDCLHSYISFYPSTDIVPQPRISSCTTGHIKNIYIGSRVHLECQITSYSDFVNVSVVENDRKQINYSAKNVCRRHIPNNTVATCAVDIHTSQLTGKSMYKLCVGYNNTVPQRPLPLCSDDVHVEFSKL